jgi:hypothetical protein
MSWLFCPGYLQYEVDLSGPTGLCRLFPVLRSQMSCPVCFSPTVLSQLSSCSSCPAQATLFTTLLTPLSFPGSPVISVPSRLTFPGSTVLPSCRDCPFPTILSQLSCPDCPVMDVLSWLPCLSGPVLDVLSQLAQLFHPGYHVLPGFPVPNIFSQSPLLFHPSCPVLAVLSYPFHFRLCPFHFRLCPEKELTKPCYIS